METRQNIIPKVILSPEPKRVSFVFSPSRVSIISRSRSCEVPDQILVSELNEILSCPIQSVDNNLSALFPNFSNLLASRDKINPIISDEKFILLEQTLSTSEDSGSDSDRFVSIFNTFN
jgi:hypothetical protein